MRRHPLVWYVWVSYPEELSADMFTVYRNLMTKQAKKSSACTYSATFCIFSRIKKAEKFAQHVANVINAQMDVISNRQRSKWHKRGVYTGYVVTPLV